MSLDKDVSRIECNGGWGTMGNGEYGTLNLSSVEFTYTLLKAISMPTSS